MKVAGPVAYRLGPGPHCSCRPEQRAASRQRWHPLCPVGKTMDQDLMSGSEAIAYTLTSMEAGHRVRKSSEARIDGRGGGVAE